MIWIVLFGVVALYLVLAYVGVRRRRIEEESFVVVEAVIDRTRIEKRRADGLTESILWADVESIQVLHRTTDASRKMDAIAGFSGTRHIPVDEPTLIVFHGEDNGAVLPAWPEVVESLLIQMRHHCSLSTQQLARVQQRIADVERGAFTVWRREG